MKYKLDLKPKEHNNKILNFFENIFALKNLYRQGWVKYWGVEEERCESVGDHVFGMAVMSYIFAKESRPDLDANRVLRIALFHDLPEAITGDIPVRDNFPAEEKQKLEESAVQKLFDGLENKEHFVNLWQEYANNESEEAKFVRQMDRLEFMMQGYFYHNHGLGKMDFTQWAKYAQKWIKDKELKKVLEEIKAADNNK